MLLQQTRAVVTMNGGALWSISRRHQTHRRGFAVLVTPTTSVLWLRRNKDIPARRQTKRLIYTNLLILYFMQNLRSILQILIVFISSNMSPPLFVYISVTARTVRLAQWTRRELMMVMPPAAQTFSSHLPRHKEAAECLRRVPSQTAVV